MFDDDLAFFAEQRSCSQGLQALLSEGAGIGRIEEDPMKEVALGSQPIEVLQCIASMNLGRGLKAQFLDVLTEHLQCGAALLHEDDPVGAPREGFQTEAAAAREKVEDPGMLRGGTENAK